MPTSLTLTAPLKASALRATPPPALALDRLPEAAQTMLAALAITPSGLSRKALLTVLQAYQLSIDNHRPDDKRIQALLQTLRKLGYLMNIDPNAVRQPSRLLPGLRNYVLHWLIQRFDFAPWTQVLTRCLLGSSDWNGSQRAHHEPQLWLTLLSNQVDKALPHLYGLMENTDDYDATHPLPLLLADDYGQEVFANLSARMRGVLLESYLEWANFYLLDQTDRVCLLGQALCEHEAAQLDALLRITLAEQMQQQALLRGDVERLRALGQSVPETHDFAEFLLALAQGQPQAALVALERWLQRVRKRTGKRKPTLPRHLQTLHWLALAGDGSAKAVAQLAKLLAAENPTMHSSMLLSLLVGALQGRTQPKMAGYMDMLVRNTKPYGFNDLLTLLVAHWLNLAPKVWLPLLRTTMQRWQQSDYAWLAAEGAALLAHYEKDNAAQPDWHAERGLKPLFTLHQRREPWQHALAALAALNQAASSKPEASATPAERRPK